MHVRFGGVTCRLFRYFTIIRRRRGEGHSRRQTGGGGGQGECKMCDTFDCSADSNATLTHAPHLNENAPRWGEGGCHPRAISLLIAIEFLTFDNDQRIAWDVPNPMVYELTYLGQQLTFQVRSNKKCSVSRVSFRHSFSSITFPLLEIERCIVFFSSRWTSLLCDPQRSLGNFDLRSPKVKVTD